MRRSPSVALRARVLVRILEDVDESRVEGHRTQVSVTLPDWRCVHTRYHLDFRRRDRLANDGRRRSEELGLHPGIDDDRLGEITAGLFDRSAQRWVQGADLTRNRGRRQRRFHRAAIGVTENENDLDAENRDRVLEAGDDLGGHHDCRPRA